MLSDHEIFLIHNVPPQSAKIIVDVAQKSSYQIYTSSTSIDKRSNNNQQNS